MTSEIIDIFDVQIEAPEQFDVVVEQTEVKLESLSITENGTYYPQGSATGFSKVEANVLPKSTDIVITENGEYNPNDYDVDAFSKVDVDVKPKLEEITATDNGTYTPSEGFDGFGKVNVDLRGKVKVTNFTVSYDCINSEGRWEGDVLIDTSLMKGTVFGNKFYSNTKIKYLDASNWNTSEITSVGQMFYGANNLISLNISGWNTSKVSNFSTVFRECGKLTEIVGIEDIDVSNGNTFSQFFQSCSSMKQRLDLRKWKMTNSTSCWHMFTASGFVWLDITGWEIPKCTDCVNMFNNCKNLETLVGDKTIDEVTSNDLYILKGIKVSTQLDLSTKLDRASLRALINGLAEVETTQTLKLGATLRAKLTEEDIAIATAKNWTIA